MKLRFFEEGNGQCILMEWLRSPRKGIFQSGIPHKIAHLSSGFTLGEDDISTYEDHDYLVKNRPVTKEIYFPLLIQKAINSNKQVSCDMSKLAFDNKNK